MDLSSVRMLELLLHVEVVPSELCIPMSTEYIILAYISQVLGICSLEPR